VQQVAVEALDPQSREAALAGRDGRAHAGVVGIGLGDEIDLFATPRDRRGDHLLGTAFGVHLGGVDERQAEVETRAQRRHFRGTRACVFAMCQVPIPRRGIAAMAIVRGTNGCGLNA